MITAAGMRATHKGWFWVCPVYVALGVDDGFAIEERHWAFAPAFWISTWLERVRIFLTSIVLSDYEPTFGVIITGELPVRS